MEQNKKNKWWHFAPEDLGGEGNFYLFWLGIGASFLGLIIYVIKTIVENGI